MQNGISAAHKRDVVVFNFGITCIIENLIRTDVEHSAAVVRAVDEQSDVDTLATHLVFCNARDVVVKRRARAVGNDDVLCGDDDFTFDNLVVEFDKRLSVAICLVEIFAVSDKVFIVFANVDFDFVLTRLCRRFRFDLTGCHIRKFVYERIF